MFERTLFDAFIHLEVFSLIILVTQFRMTVECTYINPNVPNLLAEEVEKCLSVIQPDRVGHGTHIHPQTEGGTPRAWKLMAQTPVEICLSSNLWCQVCM